MADREDRSGAEETPLLDRPRTVDATRWGRLHPGRTPEVVSPDDRVIDQAGQDRPGTQGGPLALLAYQGLSRTLASCRARRDIAPQDESRPRGRLGDAFDRLAAGQSRGRGAPDAVSRSGPFVLGKIREC